jgi:hypothetical protein
MKIGSILSKLLAAVLMVGTLVFVQALVTPKYTSGIVEGSLTGEYYAETTPHDVIFIGDCEAYETFSPITLWNGYGITSYVRGSAQQLMWQSYALLEETLAREKPKVVVLSLIAMKYDEPQKEAYNRMTLDGMRWSAAKVEGIRASMMPDEHFLDYVFPLLRFHSRWSELTADDFRYLFAKPKLFHNGYYMRVDVKPVTTIPVGKKLPDYRFGANAMAYLDRITQLCKDKGVQLILNKAPTIYPYWYPEWDQQMVDYAADHDLRYYNFLALSISAKDEIGIDFQTDTYDAGLHLNLSGVEKLSTYFGRILRDDYAVPDRRDDEGLAAVYLEKTAFYDAMRDRQLAELAQYGHLLGIGAQPAP